jgi:Na+(H+)/acetate symporter ActP
MNQLYKEKRNNAFCAWIALWLISSFLYGLMIGLPDEHTLKAGASLGWFVTFIFQLKYWFEGFSCWAKAKGKSGWFSILGVLGPIGLIVMFILSDKGFTPQDSEDPKLKCPNCGAEYKISEYKMDAVRISCSSCGKGLER